MHLLLKNKPKIAVDADTKNQLLKVESQTYSATVWTLSEVYYVIY